VRNPNSGYNQPQGLTGGQTVEFSSGKLAEEGTQDAASKKHAGLFPAAQKQQGRVPF